MRIQPLLLGFVMAAGCGELSRTPGSGDAGERSFRLTCDTCVSDTRRCVGGECEVSCDPDAPGQACFQGFRCDRLMLACLPDHVPSCDEEPCNTAQRCVSDYCVVASPLTCLDGGGCLSTDWCEAGGTCLSLPPCDADGSCRPGTLGATCNRRGLDGLPLDPQKEADLCLVGRCTSDAHCPSPLTCREIGAELAGLGVCR